MKTNLGDVLLPERPVRWLGFVLITTAFVLPPIVLLVQAASWTPPPPEPVANVPDFRPAMVILEGGTFLMGSPKDKPGLSQDEAQHEVTASSFMISLTEVSQGHYAAVMGKNPVEGSCAEWGVGEDRPVVCVSWLDAVRYCNELSRREGLDPAYEIRREGLDPADGIQDESVTWFPDAPGYRLPTEAEWEYAARAGTQHRWVGTDREEEVCDFGNVRDASAKAEYGWEGTFACDDKFPSLAPVTAYRPNRWLLLGFGGNAREWVWDESLGGFRVNRGGSFGSDPLFSRMAFRGYFEPSWRDAYLGFRVARSLPSTL